MNVPSPSRQLAGVQRALLAWVAVLLVASSAFGQGPSPSSGPPNPRSDSFDWVQLTNGEWLKGEIKELQDDSFTFESDELDKIQLDWEDVATLYSPRLNTLMFEDWASDEGRLDIDATTVTVTDSSGISRTYPRSTLRAIIPGKRTEWTYWSGRLSFGGTVRQGNTDQADLTAAIRIARYDGRTRFRTEYNGAISSVNSTKTADNHRWVTTLDFYLTRDLYVTVPSFTVYRDQFQNIDYRLTPGAGVGYDVIDRDGLRWTVSGGIGYEFTKFTSVTPGEPDTNDTFAILFGTEVDWEATKRVDIVFDFNVTLPVPEARTFNTHLSAGLEVDIWKELELDVTFIWDHQNSPAASDTGTTKPNDLRLYVGIGYEF